MHLNASEIPYPLIVILEARKKVPVRLLKWPPCTSQDLLPSSDEAGLKTSLRQQLQFLSTQLLLSVNFKYGTFSLLVSDTISWQSVSQLTLTMSGCSVPLHHISHNLAPSAFKKMPWEQSFVSWSLVIVRNDDDDDDDDDEFSCTFSLSFITWLLFSQKL